MISTLLTRARTRPDADSTRPEDERGSLVLDILIGMAIFALVAIIAVTAVGQYRMRAYIQTAMSDAQATANAVHAAITDNAVNDPSVTYPTGLLTDDDLAALKVTPTGRGTNTSDVTVIANTANPERFTVCVEHRGAYAEYESEQGLVASGNASQDNYLGCNPDDSDGGDGGDGGDSDVATPTNVDVSVENDDVTITWDPVDGTTTYLVHLDDEADPAWSGSATTTTLPDVSAGDHTVTVTATVGPDSSAPSTPTSFTVTTGPTTTPADWTGYPDNLTGYGTQNASVPCPTLVGVESWHRWMGEYNYAVTFEQSPADFKATHTTTSGYRYKYRVIPASTGVPSSWQYNDTLNSHPLTANQGWGIVPGSPAEGDVFYLEVIGQAAYAGAYGEKCNTVGKFSVRYTPNWTNGVVQTLDGSPLDVSVHNPNTSPVPCPVLTDAATWRDLYDDHASIAATNIGSYEALYRLEGGDWYLARNDGHRGTPYRQGPINRDAPAGSSHVVEFLLRDTTTGFRSENCTSAVRLTRTPSTVEKFVTKPIEQITVDPFW